MAVPTGNEAFNEHDARRRSPSRKTDESSSSIPEGTRKYLQMLQRNVPATEEVSDCFRYQGIPLPDNRMIVHFTTRDRPGLLAYFTKMVGKKLRVDAASMDRLHEESCSSFLISGPRKRLNELTRTLEKEEKTPISSLMFTETESHDIYLIGKGSGLIHEVATLFGRHEINMVHLECVSASKETRMSIRIEVPKFKVHELDQVRKELKALGKIYFDELPPPETGFRIRATVL